MVVNMNKELGWNLFVAMMVLAVALLTSLFMFVLIKMWEWIL